MHCVLTIGTNSELFSSSMPNSAIYLLLLPNYSLQSFID
jgi:hypothetical protein